MLKTENRAKYSYIGKKLTNHSLRQGSLVSYLPNDGKRKTNSNEQLSYENCVGKD